MLKKIAVGTASFIVLDGVWLGVIMKSFYREHLGPIAMTAPDGSLAPIWAAAAPVYVLMALGLTVFVMPRVSRAAPLDAAKCGAVFGLVLFGVYDLTNLSTLRNYSPMLALIDTGWGIVSCAITAVVMKTVAGKS